MTTFEKLTIKVARLQLLWTLCEFKEGAFTKWDWSKEAKEVVDEIDKAVKLDDLLGTRKE